MAAGRHFESVTEAHYMQPRTKIHQNSVPVRLLMYYHYV